MVVSSPIVKGRYSAIRENWLGNDSTEKKIPEKKIENRPTKRLVTFPTLKIIISDADKRPMPMNGIEL